MTERHPHLHALARMFFRFPGLKAGAHWLLRFALAQPSIPRGIRERLYNFFSRETAPSNTVLTKIRSPSGKSLYAELDLTDDLSRTWCYQGYQSYEPGTARLWGQLAQQKSCVVEVGANIGYYTLVAAQQLEGRGEIHSFEPFPPNFKRLSRNVKLNGFRCVHLNRNAVSDRDGKALLFLPSDRSSMTPSLVKGYGPQEGHCAVRTVRLATYCRENGLGKLDLVKIDAEGHGLAILQGMGTRLFESKPDFILEVLPMEEKALDAFFAGTTYKKFLITPSGLEERTTLVGHPHLRDYYLCSEAPGIRGMV